MKNGCFYGILLDLKTFRYSKIGEQGGFMDFYPTQKPPDPTGSENRGVFMDFYPVQNPPDPRGSGGFGKFFPPTNPPIHVRGPRSKSNGGPPRTPPILRVKVTLRIGGVHFPKSTPPELYHRGGFAKFSLKLPPESEIGG